MPLDSKYFHTDKCEYAKASGIWATVTLGTRRPIVVSTPSLAPILEQSTTGAEKVVWPDEGATTFGMAPRFPNMVGTSTLLICMPGGQRS